MKRRIPSGHNFTLSEITDPPLNNREYLQSIIDDCNLQIKILDEQLEAYKDDKDQVTAFEIRKKNYKFMIQRLVAKFY